MQVSISFLSILYLTVLPFDVFVINFGYFFDSLLFDLGPLYFDVEEYIV